MKLLSLANFSRYGETNTALHRHRALCKIFSNQVDEFNTDFHFGFSNKVLNKVFMKGINFPFIHDILIDTTSFEVLHLISAMRD